MMKQRATGDIKMKRVWNVSLWSDSDGKDPLLALTSHRRKVVIAEVGN